MYLTNVQMLLQFFSAVDIVYYAMFPQIGLLQRQQCSDVILAFIERKLPQKSWLFSWHPLVSSIGNGFPEFASDGYWISY